MPCTVRVIVQFKKHARCPIVRAVLPRFLVLVLPAHPVLYCWAAAALALSLLGRLLIALQSVRRVDAKKRGWFALGTLIMLVEPMSGTRVLRRSFIESEATGGVMVGGGAVKKDARAIAATNEYFTAKSEIRNSVLLVLLEDVNALVIEAWFLWLQGGSSQLNSLFFLTVAGTLLHMVRQCSEIVSLRQALPHLLEVMGHRDKAFGENTSDAGLLEFAQRSQLACRRCDARLCSGSISDEGVAALAQRCVALDSIDLGTNRGVGLVASLSDQALLSVGLHCTVLTKLFLTDCNEWVTDRGVVAIAQGCPLMSKLSLRKCGKVTDVGVLAVARHCHSLRMVMLNDTQIGDAVRHAIRATTKHSHRGCHRLNTPNAAVVCVQGVRALSVGCHALRDLYACGTNVTDGCLTALLQLELAESIWLKRNPGISPISPTVVMLRERRPRLDLRIE